MTHQAMQVTKLDEPLSLQDVDDRPIADNELRVDVAACGLNFGDLLMIKGTYQEKFDPPFTPGMEISGIVSEVGGHTKFSVGTRIAAYCGVGGLAKSAVIHADQAVAIPSEMSDIDAAAFFIAYGTSHVALVHRAKLQRGEKLLVLGASGGVGLTAVELGAKLGAEVIACARGSEKLKISEQAGAHHLVDSDTDDIREIVKKLGGADVVYDPVGGDQFKAALRACNPEARVLPLGFASGEVPQVPANIILVKNISVLGFYWGGYARFAPDILTKSFEELIEMYVSGLLKPHVSHVMQLADTNAALNLLRQRRSTGKVVVKM